MNNQNLNTTQILIHQCNHWFSEYIKLKKSLNNEQNYHLMIEALGCAKGNLCALKELDLKNSDLYLSFLKNIDVELDNIYKKQKLHSKKNKYILYEHNKNLTQSSFLN